MTLSRVVGWSLLLVAVAFPVLPVSAAPSSRGAPGHPAVVVPLPLEPWVPWVLHDEAEEKARCPELPGRDDQRICAWPARLALSLDDRGGTFSQEWEVFKAGLAPLPGSDERWPLDVRVDGKAAPVVPREGTPVVELAPGAHVVSGRFAWDTLPDALTVPEESGLVSLSVRDQRVDFPLRDDEGRVFLGRDEEPAEADTVDISVHRKLTDEAPLLLHTRLQLAVSGKSRELLLGRALPAGFELQAVEGDLPLHLDPGGKLRVQVRPGTWVLMLTARRVTSEKTVTRPQPDGPWKAGEEVWVFEPRPELRLADVQGVPTVDPAQTTLPAEWKGLPAYILAPGATITLVERRRGDSDAPPDQLHVERRLWLDFDGGGYTVSDHITGRWSRSWRLEAAPPNVLGRVAIDGRDQFITRVGPPGPGGVEIRGGRAEITADSRIEDHVGRVTASGFLHDFESLAARLELPPGWRLLHATGADDVSGTWVDLWSLLDFFLLLVTALAVQRLFGWRLGLIALLGLGLTITERDAPSGVWLAVLLGEALVRALRAGKLLAFARLYRIAAWAVLLGSLVPYAVSEVRRGVHPATEHEPSFAEEATAGLLIGTRAAPAPPPAAALAEQAQGYAKGDVVDNLEGASSSETRVRRGVAAVEKKKAQKIVGGNFGAAGVAASSSAYIAQNRNVYDPTVVVQTGPGLPTWTWSTARLTFNGPVRQDQELRFFLVPPSVNLVLSLLRVALLAALALLILRRPLRLGGGWHPAAPFLGAATAAALILGAGIGLSRPARAAEALPTPEWLDALKDRLLEEPDCHPSCGAIGRLALEASPRELRLVLEVSAAAPTAIPLPGGKEWSPTDVRVDGKKAAALARTDDGVLWLALPAGVFRVQLDGPLPARETVALPMPLQPRVVSARVKGWTLDGVHEDGAVDESVKLTRQSQPGAGKAGSVAEPTAGLTLPPFVRVERTLHLGLKWEVDTVVRRETPAGLPVVLDVPLLPGEAVTTPGARVDKGKSAVTVSLGPDATEASWHATLSESPEIHLRADPATATRWAETWRLDLGPTWHATLSGIPATRRAGAGTDEARVPEWRPWPGEEVRIALEKPAGVPGQTLTIDAASLALGPSVRMTRATLTFEVRSSRATQHAITLPGGAELESVKLDDTPQLVRPESDGRRLILPIAPRRQRFAIVWRDPTALSALFRAPAVDLGIASPNVSVRVDLSQAPRWLLWTAGPPLGPAVHFWSLALVLLLLAWALARSRIAPLRWWDWLLLGLGLSQMPLPATGLVALFLLGLGWRARHPVVGRPVRYDLSQLAFAGLAVASIVVLFSAVKEGLLSHPDMRVVGNGSSDRLLQWYQDRARATLPRPWALSAPLLVYRGVMLAWSLWLAVACLRWARWAWQCFKEHGLWQPRKPRIQTAISPPPAADPSEGA